MVDPPPSPYLLRERFSSFLVRNLSAVSALIIKSPVWLLKRFQVKMSHWVFDVLYCVVSCLGKEFRVQFGIKAEAGAPFLSLLNVVSSHTGYEWFRIN